MDQWQQRAVEGSLRPVRRVLRLIERSIDKRGQVPIVPELTLEGWTTSLADGFSADEIIGLYADHGTHEQFHPEFRTELDLTRLPSGKFDTNHLVCQLGRVGDECAAPDGPARAARPRCTGTPRRQEAAHQDGDAGVDLTRRALDPDGAAHHPRVGCQRQGGQGLRPVARRVVRCVHVAVASRDWQPHGSRKSRSARVAV